MCEDRIVGTALDCTATPKRQNTAAQARNALPTGARTPHDSHINGEFVVRSAEQGAPAAWLFRISITFKAKKLQHTACEYIRREKSYRTPTTFRHLPSWQCQQTYSTVFMVGRVNLKELAVTYRREASLFLFSFKINLHTVGVFSRE